MLLGTLATYLATLALSAVLCEHVFGLGGLDWKVQLFLFVIVVAVGQDYNIFLVSRYLAERKTHPLRRSIRTALTASGPVISNCGLIMAATLGSLAVTGLRLMQQLGLALAVGILLDAFLVRPVVLPAFLMIRERWKQRVR
jgi:RND superfamily putative drug exporter